MKKPINRFNGGLQFLVDHMYFIRYGSIHLDAVAFVDPLEKIFVDKC